LILFHKIMKEQNKNTVDLNILRHSLSHIMAHAVQDLYPGTKFGIGPAIENGFYYDFGLDKNFTPEDLPKIESKMRELIRKDLPFEKEVIPKEKAQEIFKNQPYKLELIKELPEKEITVYKSGNFLDLCGGPHIKSTKEIPTDAFKLQKTAGAYWRGSEKNPMLQRIYGLAFENKKALEDYLKLQQEAEKRDHRILGQKLDLFFIDEEVGAGLPIWQHNGTILRKVITDYLYEELSRQKYLWIISPHIGRLQLWKTSGHWENYRENMYSPIKIEEEEYMIKPMNCPFHVKVYKTKIRSYRDLPIKYAEFGTVYRYERSGTLHGLTRVRGFTQDDAHIICRTKQLQEEVEKLLKTGFKIMKAFGFKDYDIYLSTRPEKYAGTLQGWEKATNTLKSILEKLKLDFQEDQGGGVFYGPKIDIKIKDSLGRPWQCTTIQVDFNLPDKFKMEYVNEKGEKEKPLMIHRALIGSLERFIGVLLEHYAGNLPFWISPVQIQVIPISIKHKKYAKEIADKLTENSLRCELKDNNETISKKIREGEMQKIPYLLVVGDKEKKAKAVAVRKRGKGDLGMMKLNKFIEKVKIESGRKS